MNHNIKLWPLIDEDISIDGLLGITHSANFAFSS
jgi:hypothetical protein